MCRYAGMGLACAIALSLTLVNVRSDEAKKSVFPPPLKLKTGFLSKGPGLKTLEWGALDAPPADEKGVKWGYYSASGGGAFTLDGNYGHAAFRWSHGLEADWHDAPTLFLGEKVDPEDPSVKYWIYMLCYKHEDHVDEVWFYISQKTQPTLDVGYRIYFGHLIWKGKRPPNAEPDEHDIHLWCTDAQRLKYHKTTEPCNFAEKK